MTDVNRRRNLCKAAEEHKANSTQYVDPAEELERERLARQNAHEKNWIDLAVHNDFIYDGQNPPGEYEQAITYLEGLDEVKEMPEENDTTEIESFEFTVTGNAPDEPPPVNLDLEPDAFKE